MEAISVGNGQLHNIGMQTVTNPLDCMHDQQIVLTGGNNILQEKEKGGDAMTSVVRRLTPLE